MEQTDKHKKKAFVETSIVMLVIILLMFIGGMTYLDPPPETGIAVNFGTSDMGKGVVQPQHNKPSKPVQQQPKVEPKVEPEIKQDVITQNTEDAPVIKNEKPKPNPKPVKPKPKPKPKPNQNVLDALNNVENAPGAATNNASGEGNDNQAGDKGSNSGDPNASGYYGNGGKNGGGGHGNYQLGNRKALSKPAPNYQCNEEGTVVVKIYVNKSGKVVRAVPGAKGSSNPAPCLLQAAKKAALNTKWSSDSKAPDQQIGKIIYHFTLTE